MSRIDNKFKELKKINKKALIAFITCGDPDLHTTEKLILEMERHGVNIIELGVPFSDPLADGPTIQEASQRALANKITLNKILNFVKDLRKSTDIPLALMTYYNPVYKFGIEKFGKSALESGVDGVIIPDLPPEEAEEFTLFKGILDIIYFISPISSSERIKMVSRAGQGFIYYVSLTGVTGARKTLSHDIKNHLRQIKKVASIPVAVGFGISTPSQAKEIAKYADGIIVGSAIIDIIKKNLGKKHLIKKVGEFVRSLREAIDNNTAIREDTGTPGVTGKFVS